MVDQPGATGVTPAEASQVSLADEVFSEFLIRVHRGESFDPASLLDRVPQQELREQLRQLIDNYQHRVLPHAAGPTSDPAVPALGQFQLLGELGRGGMGVVHLALDKVLNRKVALKVLPSAEAQDERVLQRFLREAKAAARLRHANIVPIYLAGNHDGTYYYSMEYVPGITLDELLRALRAQHFSGKGPLIVRRFEEHGEPVLRLVQKSPQDPPSGNLEAGQPGHGITVLSFSAGSYVREALKLFADVAEALDYAHREGIVHRDIKPANLILAADGRLMVADFGLAKIGGAQSITRTGDFMGSPGYMSPEQAMARRIPIDHRTDIWSLGVTLYEFLTRQHPFQAPTIEVTLKRIITQDPRPARLLNPRLPKDVETILTKTLEKNPDHRYATAGELARDLQSVLNYESIQAKSHGPITRTLRLVRRNVARVTSALLALALVVVGLWAWSELRDREQREVERYFASVRSRFAEEANPLVDEEMITGIQDALRGSIASMQELSAAIDQLGMRAADAVAVELATAGRDESLRTVMRALAKVRAIYFHNPNRIERDRMERIDRATADQRIRIVKGIADRLRAQQRAAGTANGREEPLWDWLCMLLGTRPMIAGIEERNPMVRVNALHAMSTLQGHRSRVLAELQRVVNEPAWDPLVLNEAVAALVSLPEATSNKEILDVLASVVHGDRRASLPVMVRYRIAQAVQESPLKKQYRDLLLRLQEDEVPKVQAIARDTLQQISGS